MKTKVNVQSLNYMFVAAFRYALPRNTFIVDEVLNKLTDSAYFEAVKTHREVYLRELEESYGKYRKAEGQYPKGWEALYVYLNREDLEWRR